MQTEGAQEQGNEYRIRRGEKERVRYGKKGGQGHKRSPQRGEEKERVDE